MISAFDASMLILLFDAEAGAPIDPATDQPVTHCQDRVRYLLNALAKVKGARIIVPAPALAEFLVRTKPKSAPDYISQIQRIRGCRIAPFAERAAIEFSEMQRVVLREHRRPARREIETRAKAKFDQQIVAIAKVEGATTIYSDDHGLGSFARRFEIETIGVGRLPLSPEAKQGDLFLEPPEPTSPTDSD